MIFHINVLQIHEPAAAPLLQKKLTKEGFGEGGRECVRGNCTYKLFKLYEMHVVYTCLSIYI